MNFKQLAYFVRVAELGSFTKASNALGIAQPALSRQVRSLEVELHKSLLNRNGRGVTLTEPGNLLLGHARGILNQVQRAKEELNRVGDTIRGRIAVGIAPSASKMMTVHFTQSIRNKLPRVSLSVSEGLSLIMQEWLLAGQLDIAVLYNPNPLVELDITPLACECLYLVGPRSVQPSHSPIRMQSIANVPLIIPNRPHTIRMLVESELANIGRKPKILFEIDSVPAILDLVASGTGYAILTEHAALTSPQPGAYHIRPIVEPNLLSRLCLATAANRPDTEAQTAVAKIIRETVIEMYPQQMSQMNVGCE